MEWWWQNIHQALLLTAQLREGRQRMLRAPGTQDAVLRSNSVAMLRALYIRVASSMLYSMIRNVTPARRRMSTALSFFVACELAAMVSISIQPTV
jgi:hypothetical protein